MGKKNETIDYVEEFLKYRPKRAFSVMLFNDQFKIALISVLRKIEERLKNLQND